MSRHRGRPRGVWRTLGLFLAWGLTAVGAGLALLYVVPELQTVSRRLAMAASFIPYGVFAWTLAVVLFVVCGRGWGKTLVLVALPGLVAQLVWASGYLPVLTSTSGRVGASVFTLNSRCAYYGKEELAVTLLERQPDLVVLQGTWTSDAEYLGESGVWDVYPYRAYFPMSDLSTCGTVVYSKSPVSRAAASTSEQPAVRVTLDGVEVVLVPADVPGPQDGVAEWEAAIAQIGQTASAAASEGWPVVVAGDFNAVREHLPFRRLIDEDGLVDAAEASGSGWLPTYRAGSWYVPLIQIDHVLVTSDIDVGTVETVRVGSRHAHLALVAWVQVG